ncbi:MAG: hypothetical protein NTY53_09875 [Kiritimatiellaeota bacterium]|nr:hypothetical protein [Kiritimatiellota bacterium]
MKSCKLLAFGWTLVVLLLVAGCRVEERMVWSPDGSRAAVRVADQLCLMDSAGKLSAPLASNVTAVAWLPDGKSLVLVRSLSLTTWAEGARLLPSNEVATVEALARGLLDTAKGALAAANGDVAAIEEKFITPLNITPSEALAPAVVCLLDTHKEALRQVFRTAKNNAEVVRNLNSPETFTVSELAVYPLKGSAPRVLERTLADLSAPCPSSTAPVVAYLRGTELRVAPLAGGTNRVVVAGKVAGRFDWTCDGRALLYAVPGTGKWEPKAINLFRIERQIVVDEHREMADSAIQVLAQAAANFEPRVRCLPDGRVLFASLTLQLPAAADAIQAALFYPPERNTQHGLPAADAMQVAHFYLVRDAHTAPVVIPTPADALPQNLAAFAPSPDGKRIAVVSAGDDEVKVVNIASGAVETVSPQRVGKSHALPAWRGPNELYFAAFPAADAKRPEWLRWSPGAAPQIISGAWPVGAVTNLVEK